MQLLRVCSWSLKLCKTHILSLSLDIFRPQSPTNLLLPAMSLPKSYSSSTHGSDMPDDQLADYKTVFPTEVAKFPYDKHKVARVAKNRAALGGQLFFDKLCTENLDRVENSKMLHSGVS